MSENDKSRSPIIDFISGICLGILFIFSAPIFFILSGLNVAITIILLGFFPFILGIINWVRKKRKFKALGYFMSIPIIIYSFFWMCGGLI